MRAATPIKTDLIIGMTLAEMFLLILFVVWYSQGASAGPDWKRLAVQRAARIQQLQADLMAEKEKVLELERIRDWWRENFSTNPPESMDQIEIALATKGIAVTKSGRSNLTPTCAERGLKDVLFSTVIRGRDLYEVNGQNKNFNELLSAYAPELHAANAQECKYSINVSYHRDVGTEDFVVALRRLRTRFYARLP